MADQFDVGKLFADPNFQSLLAGIGARLDPQGVGGALGGAAQQYIQSKAAQKGLEGQEQKRSGQSALLLSVLLPDDDPRKAQLREQGIRMLGGIDNLVTPPDKQGLTSIKAGPKGNVILDYNPQDVKPSAPMNPQGPYSQETTGTSSSSVAAAAPSGTATLSTEPRRKLDISDVVPFY